MVKMIHPTGQFGIPRRWHSQASHHDTLRLQRIPLEGFKRGTQEVVTNISAPCESPVSLTCEALSLKLEGALSPSTSSCHVLGKPLRNATGFHLYQIFHPSPRCTASNNPPGLPRFQEMCGA